MPNDEFTSSILKAYFFRGPSISILSFTNKHADLNPVESREGTIELGTFI
jgi:hypothetical protein